MGTATDIAAWQEYLQTEETMPQIVDRMVRNSPDRKFITAVNGVSVTWKELGEQSDAWAARFVELGVRRGDFVATFLEAGLESLSIWIGLTRIGAIDTAVNPEFRGRMLADAIKLCAPSLLVVTKQYVPHLEEIAKGLEGIVCVLLPDAGGSEGREGVNLPGIIRAEEVDYDLTRAREQFITPKWSDIACITYTSGTTGVSKAVRMPWGQLHCIVLACFPYEDLTSSDVIYCTTNHAHFASKSMPYLAALKGAQAVIRFKFSQSAFWNDVARFGITTASLVATMADMIARDPKGPGKNTTLRNVFMAPLGASYLAFKERFGSRICTVYNNTEGGVPLVSGWNPQNDRMAGRLREGYPGFEVRIVDEEDNVLPDGEPGELIVRSGIPWTMNDGYHNNPEATVTAWRNGWFHSGDQFLRTSDGEYILVDRLKDSIRRRGENISSFEIETDVLLNKGILECAAVAFQITPVEDEILLFAVKREGSALTPEALYRELSKRMPRFMIPRFIEFVDSFPKTAATGRIKKAELRERGISSKTWDREAAALDV